METKFLAAWQKNREAAQNLGVRLRPQALTMELAYRQLSGHRESDGFGALAQKGRLDLSLEALAVKKPYTQLFSDEQANTALLRLLDADYSF